MRAAPTPAAAVALMALAAPAAAHIGHVVPRAERALRLDLSRSPPALTYTLVLGAPIAARERAAADEDGDGAVSAAEGNAALDRLGASLAAAVHACHGRSLQKLACRPLRPADLESSSGRPWTSDDKTPMTLAWTFRLPHASDDGAVRVEDAWDRFEADRTDVAIVAHAKHPLVRAGDGDAATGVAREFAWIDPIRAGRPRAVVAAWKPPPPSWMTPAAIAGGLAAGAALALWRKRRTARAG